MNMFDGTYPLPGNMTADYTQRSSKIKEEKEITIIKTSVAYAAWDEGLRMYNESCNRDTKVNDADTNS